MCESSIKVFSNRTKSSESMKQDQPRVECIYIVKKHCATVKVAKRDIAWHRAQTSVPDPPRAVRG